MAEDVPGKLLPANWQAYHLTSQRSEKVVSFQQFYG